MLVIIVDHSLSPTNMLKLNHKLSQMKGVLRIGYQFQNKEAIILRDYLAMERTRLASERTFMAYIRTSLFFLTGGLTLLQFERFANLNWLGYLSILICTIMLIVGIYRFLSLNDRIKIYYEQIKKDQNKITEKKEADAREASANQAK